MVKHLILLLCELTKVRSSSRQTNPVYKIKNIKFAIKSIGKTGQRPYQKSHKV